MKKTVRIGTIEGYSIFAKIEIDKGNLSISGVHGPKSNGDAYGSCGQIDMSFKECDKRGHMSLADITPAPGWDAATIAQFFAVWRRWHLNDMRANCEHQVGPEWDTSREVEVIHYGLTSEAYQDRKKLIDAAAEATARGELLTLTSEQRALLGLSDWWRDRFTPPDADSPLSGMFEVKKRETETAGWVHPSEHPGGLLSKPCHVCRYKYGSEWKREELPADVVEFLQSLPDTDKTPAWV